MRAERTDDRLGFVDKPQIKDLGTFAPSNGEILVACCGFEDRAIASLEHFVSAGQTDFNPLLIRYLPHVADNREPKMEQLCTAVGLVPQCLDYDRYNPAGLGLRIAELAQKCSGRVFVDVSGMSRLLIVQIITALGQSSRGFRNITVLYTEAMQYPPSESEVQKALTKTQSEDSFYRSMFLSSGVYEVSTVAELSSVALQGQPTRLVVFPSFNTDQFAALRHEIQPTYFSIINGAPPLPENSWRTAAIRELNTVDSVPRREELTVSTLDYRETLDCLLNIYREHGAIERIVVAPTGSKMQSVATGIFRAFMNDIRISYPTPRTFSPPPEYTIGVRQIYQLDLSTFSVIDP